MNLNVSVLCPVCDSQNISLVSSYKSDNDSFLGANTLQSCGDCGLVFAWPMPSDDALDKYYRESIYYDDKTPFSRNFYDFSYRLTQSRLRLIFKHIALSDGGSWLDVGAGNAILGRALKAMQPNVIYEAVEPSATCRQGWGDWVSAFYDDLSHAPPESYEVITLNQVLEHVNNPLQFLKDIAGLLQEGGHLFIDVPYRDDIFKPSIEPHLLFWETGSLSYAVEQAGLEVLFCESVGMEWARAKRLFAPTLVEKIADPWMWISRMNKVLKKLGVEKQFNTFGRFQADAYGGQRQWLRCLARKVQ